MKLEVLRYSLVISPESPEDEAWIEEVLNLKKERDSIPLIRYDLADGSLYHLNVGVPEP